MKKHPHHSNQPAFYSTDHVQNTLYIYSYIKREQKYIRNKLYMSVKMRYYTHIQRRCLLLQYVYVPYTFTILLYIGCICFSLFLIFLTFVRRHCSIHCLQLCWLIRDYTHDRIQHIAKTSRALYIIINHV